MIPTNNFTVLLNAALVPYAMAWIAWLHCMRTWR
jgi:hypothetical protein